MANFAPLLHESPEEYHAYRDDCQTLYEECDRLFKMAESIDKGLLAEKDIALVNKCTTVVTNVMHCLNVFERAIFKYEDAVNYPYEYAVRNDMRQDQQQVEVAIECAMRRDDLEEVSRLYGVQAELQCLLDDLPELAPKQNVEVARNAVHELHERVQEYRLQYQLQQLNGKKLNWLDLQWEILRKLTECPATPVDADDSESVPPPKRIAAGVVDEEVAVCLMPPLPGELTHASSPTSEEMPLPPTPPTQMIGLALNPNV